MAPKNTLLAISHELPPVGGGGGIGFFDILSAMPAGVSTDIITSLGPGLPARETAGNITIYRVGLRMRINVETGSSKAGPYLALAAFSLCALFKAAGLCLTRRYDAIVSNYLVPAGVVGGTIAYLFGIRHAANIVEGDIMDAELLATKPHGGLLIPAAIRFAARSADRLLAISGYAREMAIRHFGITKPVEVVNFGIKNPGAPVSAQPAPGAFTLAFLGRLVERKGAGFLLDALAGLPADVKLKVIGDGPLAEKLRSISEKPGLAGRVSFLGRLDEAAKRRELASSDVFVFPSVREGLGLVAMEAMAAGLPVISTRSGGTSDFMRENVNALFVDHGDTEQLKAAVLKLRDDPALRAAMGSANRAKAPEFFVEKIAARYLEIAAGPNP